MMRPKKNKEPKVKLTKDSWRKAARFLKYLKSWEVQMENKLKSGSFTYGCKKIAN